MATTEMNRPRFDQDFPLDPSSGPEHFKFSETDFNLPPLYTKTTDAAKQEATVIIEEQGVKSHLDPDTSFGPIVRPEDPSLLGYKNVLRDSDGVKDIRFSRHSYPIFDNIIVRECGFDDNDHPTHPAFRNAHPLHLNYAPLRRNLAILRNYLMASYPPFGPEGASHIAVLKALASRLGYALCVHSGNKTVWQRFVLYLKRRLGLSTGPFKSTRFLELANTPDRGIAFMYQYLCLYSESQAFRAALPKGQLPMNWKLVPLEETPFSSENILLYADASRMTMIANAFDQAINHFRPVDDMQREDKEISVEHARDILRNLRVIINDAMEEKVVDSIDTRIREAQSMLQASLCFAAALQQLALSNPEMLTDPTLMEAKDTVGKISGRVKGEQQIMAKEENRPELAQKPAASATGHSSGKKAHASKPKQKEPIGQMMHKLEEGLNRVHEIRKTHQAKAKHKSAQISAGHEMAQKHAHSVKNVVKDTANIMSSPKISQVSLADPEFIRQVRELNEQEALQKEQQRTSGGGQSVPGRK